MIKMKRRDIWKRAGAVALAAAVLGNCSAFPGSGLLCAQASTVTPLGEYTEAEMTAFADNVLEYWEIQGLVEHYNPDYLKQLAVFNGNPDGSSGLSKDQLLVMADLFRYEAKELKNEAEDLKDSISEEAYQEYQDNIKTLKSYAKEQEKAANGTAATKRALRQVRNYTMIEVCSMMREYQKLVSQNTIAQKSLEIAELSFGASGRQKDLGMISAEEYLLAQDSYAAVKASAEAAAATLNQSRQTLIMALGWDYDGNPEIVAIPEPDVTKADAYDLAADMETAVGANYDVAEIRRTDKSEFNGTQDKLRQIAEKEDQVRMQMEYLYQDVQQKRFSYQSALEGWTVAEQKLAQNGRKLELGMISRAEYLAEELSWLNTKASKEQAALDLLAAMETYEWALKGLMTL